MRMSFNIGGPHHRTHYGSYHDYYNVPQQESDYIKNLNKESLRSKDTSKAKAKKASFKTWGTVLLCIGIALFAIGFIGFATSGMTMVMSFGSDGITSPFKFWIMCAVAMPFLIAGSVLLGKSRQILDDLQELQEKYGEITSGVESTTTQTATVTKKVCDYCGSENGENDKYCASCGAPLKTKRK